MPDIIVVGVDPGMASTGFCVVGISRDNLRDTPPAELRKVIEVLGAGLITTAKDKSQNKVTNDRANRVRDIAKAISYTYRRYELSSPIIAGRRSTSCLGTP